MRWRSQGSTEREREREREKEREKERERERERDRILAGGTPGMRCGVVARG